MNQPITIHFCISYILIIWSTKITFFFWHLIYKNNSMPFYKFVYRFWRFGIRFDPLKTGIIARPMGWMRGWNRSLADSAVCKIKQFSNGDSISVWWKEISRKILSHLKPNPFWLFEGLVRSRNAKLPMRIPTTCVTIVRANILSVSINLGSKIKEVIKNHIAYT